MSAPCCYDQRRHSSLKRPKPSRRALTSLGFPTPAVFTGTTPSTSATAPVTPGLYDYRATLDNFHFPENMEGMTVLDVGSATGFFAFEFERRGTLYVPPNCLRSATSRSLPRPERGKLAAKNRADDLSRRPRPRIPSARRLRAGTLPVPARRAVQFCRPAPGFRSRALLLDHLRSHPGKPWCAAQGSI